MQVTKNYMAYGFKYLVLVLTGALLQRRKARGSSAKP